MIPFNDTAGGHDEDCNDETLSLDDYNKLSNTTHYDCNGLLLYFITFKCNMGDPSDIVFEHYDDCFRKMKRKGIILESCYERDSRGRLHIHAILKARPRILLRDFHMYGYSCKIKNVYDGPKLVQYLRKIQKIHIDNSQYMF